LEQLSLPDGCLTTTGDDGNVLVWDVDSLRQRWLERGDDPLTAITYGPGEDVQRHTHTAH